MRIRNIAILVLVLLLCASLLEGRRKRRCPRKIEKKYPFECSDEWTDIHISETGFWTSRIREKFRDCCEGRQSFYWVRPVRKAWRISKRFKSRFRCMPGCIVEYKENDKKKNLFLPADEHIRLGCFDVVCVPTMTYRGDRISRCDTRKRQWTRICFGIFGR